jgi:hypothetical protein
MDITQSQASNIIRAVGASAVPGGFARGPIVMAVASLLSEELDSSTPGISWRDDRDGSNALLVLNDALIHAVAPTDGKPRCTVYRSPVGTVEAAEVTDLQDSFAGGLSWIIGAWHVTLEDGTVISIASVDNNHSDLLEAFVRQHLLT